MDDIIFVKNYIPSLIYTAKTCLNASALLKKLSYLPLPSMDSGIFPQFRVNSSYGKYDAIMTTPWFLADIRKFKKEMRGGQAHGVEIMASVLKKKESSIYFKRHSLVACSINLPVSQFFWSWITIKHQIGL